MLIHYFTAVDYYEGSSGVVDIVVGFVDGSGARVLRSILGVDLRLHFVVSFTVGSGFSNKFVDLLLGKVALVG
jgi:hypothetical protein